MMLEKGSKMKQEDSHSSSNDDSDIETPPRKVFKKDDNLDISTTAQSNADTQSSSKIEGPALTVRNGENVSMCDTVLKIMRRFSDGNTRGNDQHRESGKIVEKFVLIDTVNILRLASEISQSTRSQRVNLENLIAVISDNEQKMQRLIYFVEFGRWKRYIQDGLQQDEQRASMPHVSSVVERCQKCLRKLGKEVWCQYLEKTTDYIDPVRQRHLRRCDMITSLMSDDELKQYNNDKKVSFMNPCEPTVPGDSNLFLMWLQYGASCLGMSVLPCTSLVLQLLAYLASGTVASCVDAVIDMRQHGQSSANASTITSADAFMSRFQQLLDRKARRVAGGAESNSAAAEEVSLFSSHSMLPTEIQAVIDRGFVKLFGE